MARKSTQELLAEIAAKLPDNTIGAITPALLREVLDDIVLAFQPAYAYLQQVAGTVLTLGLTPVQVGFVTAFDSLPSQSTSTGGAAAQIAITDRGTTSFEFTADIETNNGRFVTFTLYKNGAPTTWRVTANGGGTGNPVACGFSAIDYADPAATYSIWASAEVDATSVTFSNAGVIAAIQPVNDYA